MPPAEADEVSLDRVFCAHHDLEVGDEVKIGGKRFTLSGICTLPDYSALFEDPGDFMFDALTFCVGELTARLGRSRIRLSPIPMPTAPMRTT